MFVKTVHIFLTMVIFGCPILCGLSGDRCCCAGSQATAELQAAEGGSNKTDSAEPASSGCAKCCSPKRQQSLQKLGQGGQNDSPSAPKTPCKNCQCVCGGAIFGNDVQFVPLFPLLVGGMWDNNRIAAELFFTAANEVSLDRFRNDGTPISGWTIRCAQMSFLC